MRGLTSRHTTIPRLGGRRLLVALGAIAALTATAPTANAATVTAEGGVLVIRGAAGEKNDLWITEAEDLAPGAVYIDDTPELAADPSLCAPAGFSSLACTMQPGGVRVEAGDGNDTVAIGWDLRASQAVTLLGGTGNDSLKGDYQAERGDRLDGGDGNDKLVGGPGADVLVGGAGDDELEGQAGADELRAGDGNDKLSADGYRDQFADIVDGGPGYDNIDGEWQVEYGKYQPPITVSLDGTADDGRPGENDNVTGIEKFYSTAPVTLIGGDAAETFTVFNTAAGSTTLTGNGGNDILNGFDHDDRIDGGAGDDTLQGGFGDDELTGGPGRDRIHADVSGTSCSWVQCRYPFGNDRVNARDGEMDSIECGIGTDVAIVDTIDVVSGCETVDAAAVAPGGTPGGTPGGATPSTTPAATTPGATTPGSTAPGATTPGATTPGSAASGGLSASVSGAKLRVALARGFVVVVETPAAGRIEVRAGRGGRIVARGTAQAASAQRTAVRVRFTKAGRRALRRAASARLTLSIGFRSSAGASSSATAVARLAR